MQEIQLPSRQIFPDFREAQAISLITNPELSSGKVFGLHAQNRKTRKSSSVQMIIQGQKPEPMVQCVSPDEEVGKNSARAGVPLCSSASNVLLEGTARNAPSGFIEIPVHRDACFFAEGIKEGLRPTGGGKKLREDRRSNN